MHEDVVDRRTSYQGSGRKNQDLADGNALPVSREARGRLVDEEEELAGLSKNHNL